MATTFYLEILTPERPFYSGPALELDFTAIDGERGVLPGHEPMVTVLNAGELRFRNEDGWHQAAVGKGFVEIMPDYVILLAETAEKPEEIDVLRAQRAKERAEERLRQQRSQEEYYRSQAALARALARLKAGQTEHRF